MRGGVGLARGRRAFERSNRQLSLDSKTTGPFATACCCMKMFVFLFKVEFVSTNWQRNELRSVL